MVGRLFLIFSGSEYAVRSNEVFDLDQFPKRLAVVGGGYIAFEFAGIFNGLGAEVTQLYRGELILRGFDNEVRDVAATEIAEKGVDLWFETDVISIEKLSNGSLIVHLSTGEALIVDTVLYATGRKPKFTDLGLDNVNVALTDKGFVDVNDQ